jgi:methionyl-tRNA synthetase
MSKKFYITTTLPYVNADPHIGFALEIVQADAIARLKRLLGFEVFFNTGTDEHGLKIFRKAQEEGLSTQKYCDLYAAKFDALKAALNLTYTHFIRTTDESHKKSAQEFWRKCDENGYIYKKNYQVKYCVGCELEKTDSELNEEKRCPIHPNLELEQINEENYFFKFSAFQQKLLDLYEKNPDFVLPRHRLTEIANFTKKGLEDFSISRLKDKMPWGVPVPNDQQHVMYVWFDALVNYVSTTKWPDPEHKNWWPGVQIAGKDNLRQQSNMWQAMLMAAGIANSTQILIHGFITSEGQKMSKSLGNVVNPFDIVEQYGADALRYYLLKEIPTYEDGDFSKERFEIVFNSELANGLGNLVFRVLSMTEKYFAEKVPQVNMENAQLNSWREDFAKIWHEVVTDFEQFEIKSALEKVMELVNKANLYIEEKKPWALAKTDQEALALVMYDLLEILRVLGFLLSPIIPQTAEKILTQLNVEIKPNENFLDTKNSLKANHQIQKGEPLFPRLDNDRA